MGWRGSPPPGGRNPAAVLETEIFRWSDRRERAEELCSLCRSWITVPATKRTEIVEQGRSRQRESRVGSLGSADLVLKASVALRPGCSAGERTGTDRDLTKGTGARSHATSTQIARSGDERKCSPDSWRPPGIRVLSLSVRLSPIIGMASAEKGQQARSEIGYPGHVEHPALVQLMRSP
jgi:hypothetical protein